MPGGCVTFEHAADPKQLQQIMFPNVTVAVLLCISCGTTLGPTYLSSQLIESLAGRIKTSRLEVWHVTS